jgi:hypothetical protein
MREFIRTEVERAMLKEYVFSEFLEEVIQRPAVFVAKCRCKLGNVSVADCAFALEVVCSMTQNWVDGVDHIEFLNEMGVNDPEFVDNFAILFNAYIMFTHFVYRLIEFTEGYENRNNEMVRVALYQLCASIPFEVEFVFVCGVRWMIGIARRLLWIRGIVEDLLAVMVESEFFDQEETSLCCTPEAFDAKSKRDPSQLVTIEGIPEPLGIPQAIQKLRMLRGIGEELDRIGSEVNGKKAPVLRVAFARCARRFVVGPAIWV